MIFVGGKIMRKIFQISPNFIKRNVESRRTNVLPVDKITSRLGKNLQTCFKILIDRSKFEAKIPKHVKKSQERA